jgi:hypothetical protein
MSSLCIFPFSLFFCVQQYPVRRHIIALNHAAAAVTTAVRFVNTVLTSCHVPCSHVSQSHHTPRH